MSFIRFSAVNITAVIAQIWTCETWSCLQTIKFEVSPKDSMPLRLKAAMDSSARYGTLSSILCRSSYFHLVLRIRIRDPVLFWPRDPLVTIFWGKSSIILWKLAQIFFFSISKINNFQLSEICGYKKRYDSFFHPSLLFLFLNPGSGMGKNKDPGSGINIPDPQHCFHCSIIIIL